MHRGGKCSIGNSWSFYRENFRKQEPVCELACNIQLIEHTKKKFNRNF